MLVEDDFFEEELTGWIPEANDGGDDDERDVAEFDVDGDDDDDYEDDDQAQVRYSRN